MANALKQIKRPHGRQQGHVEFADDPSLSRAPGFLVDGGGGGGGGFGAGDFELVDVFCAAVFGLLVCERRGAAVAGEGGETHCCGFAGSSVGRRVGRVMEEKVDQMNWIGDMSVILDVSLLPLLLRTTFHRGQAQADAVEATPNWSSNRHIRIRAVGF